MLKIALLSFALTSSTAYKAGSADEVIEEMSLAPQLVEPISLQQVHQFQHLSDIKILLPAAVKVMQKPETCDVIPTYGLKQGQAAVSITGDSQSVGNILMNYDEGRLSIETADATLTAPLDITIYVDSLDSIVLKRFEESSVLSISLTQNDKAHIGLIDAPSVNITMKGHGLLEIDHLSGDSVNLKMDGHGKIFLPQINAQHVDVLMDGHGEMMFSGKVESQKIRLSGHGSYNAKDMTSKQAELYVRGHAKSKLLVKQNLTLDVLEFENVSFRGEAKVTRENQLQGNELSMLSAL